jgi:glycine/serine hydroxymethyltransferase
MSISKPGDNIMLLSSNYGGHASVKGICQRLSLNVFDAPYLLDEYDFDYELLNKMLVENNIHFLLPAPSDILFPFELDKVKNDKVVILYDASQILGLMGANIIQNPLPEMDNMILFGGTHKTLPGPAHGIAVTNNENLFKILDRGINPQFLRNTQMHQVISLLFCLIEFEYFGKEYQSNIVRISNVLAKYLEDIGFTIAKKSNIYSTTHQVFIECSVEKMDVIYSNAITAGVTLNTKKKALFHGGYGIRLGTQEIARYQWDDSVLAVIAEIVHLLSRDKCDFKKIEILKKNIPEKTIKFTFGEDELKTLTEALKF